MSRYEYQPDVFDLLIEKSDLGSFILKGMQTDFGITQEKYCYLDDICLGLVLGEACDSRGYYSGLGLDCENKIAISLAPAIVNKSSFEMTEIKKNEIESFQKSGISPMPERLLDALSIQQIADLLAYLEAGAD